jgi:alkylation response protein AidB-like acyl-CoA dehydrogenase
MLSSNLPSDSSQNPASGGNSIPEALTPVSEFDESGFAKESFKSVDLTVKATSSLLDATPTQAAYIKMLQDLLQPYGVHEVQKWDETKQPPVEILKKMTADGVFVSGVPMPAMSVGASLVNDASLSALIEPAAKEKLVALLTPNPSRKQTEEFLQDLGADGYAKAMALASIEIPKKTSVGVATFLGVNTGLSAQTISKIGTPEQQAFWLNALNNGVFTYGFGLTEEKIGSDPRSLQTTFKKETDAEGNTVYRLNGNKKFIGNGARVTDKDGNVTHRGADFLLVYAVDDSEKAPKDRSFRVFMVPRTLIGEENIWHSGREHNKMGLREVNNGDFNLKDVVIPESCLIGKPDEDIYPKMAGLLDITRLFVGAMSTGTAQGAFEAAKEYSARRVQNGGLINQFQMVSFPLEDVESKLLVAKLLVMDAARLVDQADREKASLTSDLADLRKDMNGALALVAARIGGASEETRQQFEAAQKKAGEKYDEMQETLKVKNNRKEIVAALSEVQKITRKLRDKFGAGEDQTAVKTAYKQLVAMIDDLKELREPVRFGTETAMAKLYCSELAEESARVAINTLGGNGFIERPEQGLGLPKRHRDAKVLTIYEGTSNIQKNIISQGVILRELKDIESNLRDALRFMLLKNSATKGLHYSILMSTSSTPVERVNAAYKYAVVDMLTRVNVSHKAIKADWDKHGVPAEYKSWDEKSIERQQNLLSSLPVQARMGILADIATDRKLVHLASRHLEFLATRPELSEEEKHHVKLLNHFQLIALDRVMENTRKLDSEALKQQEDRYMQAYSRK